jgi:phosphoribosyl-ATP pyrophosphohydrolase
MLKKIGEEATETVLAAKDGEPQRIVHETADLWFHCLVMLVYKDISAAAILAELEKRFGQSGIAKKAGRIREA